MIDIDQSRLNNRVDDSPVDGGSDPAEDLVDAKEASDLLGVKPATLYTYVSRGRLRSVLAADGRSRRYVRAEVLRLRDRARARSGHGPVAAGAMDWGEPVLDTAVGTVTPDGPVVRGRSLVELAESGWTLDRVAELLWEAPVAGFLGGDAVRSGADTVQAAAAPLDQLAMALPVLAGSDPARFNTSRRSEVARATALLPTVAALLGLRAALESAEVGALHTAAIVSVDHGLNASTFAARVVASTGADLYACLSAAVAALSGPRHGGACARIEALIDDVERVGGDRAVQDRLRRGETIPGFHHPLYPQGDPRTGPLLRAAEAVPAFPSGPFVDTVRAMDAAGYAPPTLDFGLVAVARALGLPRGGGTALFALGRTVGWVAHILEQRTRPGLLRPRAGYTVPPGG